VVVEEFMTGPEFSFLCFVDGPTVVPMVLSQDHKRAFDGDKGPNTGGMGAYTPLPFITEEDRQDALEHIMKPVAAALVEEGCPFRGVLYGGLMKTPQGIKVVEFNCRFGDPETEVVLPRLQSDIYDVFCATADGALDTLPPLRWSDEAVLGIVLASKGYPGSYDKGVPIEGLAEAAALPGVRLYHMGTKMQDGKTVTAGGRVLMAVAQAPTLPEANARALQAVAAIRCEGLFHRSDIGHQAL
jgi:phosphoribosylamine--glycine ligase